MLPDFLCIGAMKAGTTWLYQNVQHHADVQMPPYKEIFYFHDVPPWPTITQIFLGKNPARRRRARRVLINHWRSDPQNTAWYLRYLMLPRTDRWYASLFRREEGKVAGDVTPTYARLDRGSVAEIHALLPDAKIIYLVRNPIRRTWSQVAMHFEQWHQGLEDAEDEEIEEFLGRKHSFKDSDYLRALDIWGGFYPQDQILVAFLEALPEDPERFLEDIYRFLDLEPADEYVPRTVEEKRNRRKYPAMPDHFGHHLARKYHPQIEKMHQRFDNRYTASWLTYAEQYL